MKYIAYIALIITAATIGLFAFGRFNTPPPPVDAALTINNRTLTLAELQNRYDRNPYGGGDRDTFYESVITRELLLQEAQRAGIDREESFRQTVQEFFEQSLIKVLMDRKYQELLPSLTPEEIAAYRSRMDKRFRLTLLRYPTVELAQLGRDGTAEPISETFLDLPALLREKVLKLKPGEKTEPFIAGQDIIVVRLDAEESLVEEDKTVLSEPQLVKKITEEKRAMMMDQWVEGLRQKAQVSFLPKSAELGGTQ